MSGWIWRVANKSSILHQTAKIVNNSARARSLVALELRLNESNAAKVNIGKNYSLLSSNHPDLGCSPKELFLSSLAASAILKIREAYANQLINEAKLFEGLSDCSLDKDLQWRHSKLEHINIEVSETPGLVSDDITMLVSFVGNLSKDQTDALILSAEHCPIRSMMNSVKLSVSVSKP